MSPIVSRPSDVLPDGHRPLLFAHRGCSADAPENSVAAFDLAAERGIPGVELDVQQCKSGEVVVFHDFTLKRITGKDGLVVEHTRAELASLDAGAWFAERFRGERIPLLSELFERHGRQFYFDIEIKHGKKRPTALEPELLRLIRKHQMEKRCLVSSFNPFAVRTMRFLAPWLPTALIFSTDREVPWLLRRGAGRFLSAPLLYKPSYSQLTKPSAFLAKGLLQGAVIPWTVNDPQEAQRLLAAGAAGLISDRPEQLRESGML